MQWVNWLECAVLQTVQFPDNSSTVQDQIMKFHLKGETSKTGEMKACFVIFEPMKWFLQVRAHFTRNLAAFWPCSDEISF